MGKLEIRDGDPALAHVEFLFEEYEPRCYLFIVYEILRRIFLTGVLGMFRAGTISQIAIGLLATIVSHRVFTFYEPYVEDDDDTVSEVAQTQLVLVFFGSLLLYVGEHTEDEASYATDLFGVILMMIMCSGLLVACYYIAVDAFGQEVIERRSRRYQARMATMARALSHLRIRAMSR